MTKIPESVMPIVEYLRENVERPVELPVRRRGGWYFHRRTLNTDIYVSPLGLLSAEHDSSRLDLSAFTFVSFVDWFNSHRSAQAAVDAVWPQWPQKEGE